MKRIEFFTKTAATVREVTTTDGKFVQAQILTREQAFKAMTDLTNMGFRLVEERTGRYYCYER